MCGGNSLIKLHQLILKQKRNNYVRYNNNATGNSGGSVIDGSSQLVINTTFQSLRSGDNFAIAGSESVWTIMDTTQKLAWRISIIFGSGYAFNLISIEQLF